jgi:hypothetical protein
MAQIIDTMNPVPIGHQETTVSPSVTKYTFYSTFALILPAYTLFLRPGRNPETSASNGQNWIIHTRSVLSWSIKMESVLGGCMNIYLGQSNIGLIPALNPAFLPVTLQGEYVWNVGSGLELPGNTFMRITLDGCEVMADNKIDGTIYLRSL